VKVPLRPALKARGGGGGGIALLSLTSALDGVGGQCHGPAALPPGKDPVTINHCIGGCVGPRAGLDGYGKSRPHWDSIPGPSSP